VSEKSLNIKMGRDETDIGILELGDSENKRKCQQKRIEIGEQTTYHKALYYSKYHIFKDPDLKNAA
jgi:hypothetical protein